MKKIYAILNNNIVVYVGQTKGTLEKRLQQHKNDKKYLKKSNFLNENECEIKLIITVPDIYASETEQNYIDKYLPTFNKISAKYDKVKSQKKSMEICLNIIKNLNQNKK